jgi:hypothetical protein
MRIGTTRIGLGIVTAVAGLPALLYTPLNHDVACALYYSRRMMAGDRLYRDIVENNPPLIFYLSMPVEWLSLRTGIAEVQAVAYACMALTMAMAWLSTQVLERDSRQTALVRWTLLLSFIGAGLVLPARDFGQREQLTVLLLFPYVLLGMARASRIPGIAPVTALAIGVAAAAGLALKPPFGLVLVALLAYVVVTRRDWRAILTIENVTVAACLSGYVAFILLWTPEYVTDMVPLAMHHYYAAYIASLSVMMRDPSMRLLLVALPLLVCCARFLTGDDDSARIVRPVALTGSVFLVTYFLGGTAYSYHQLPALAFCTMAGAAALAAVMQTRSAHLVLRIVLTVVCVAPAMVVGWRVLDSTRADRHAVRSGVRFGVHPPLLDIVRREAAGQPMFVLSSSVRPAFPLLNLAGARWPYRFNSLWPLPAYYRDDANAGVAAYHRPEAQSAGERSFFQAIVRDLREIPPAILIVDRSRYKQGFGAVNFDFLDYFSQSPELAALFREYELITHLDPFDIYKHRAPAHAAQLNRQDRHAPSIQDVETGRTRNQR